MRNVFAHYFTWFARKDISGQWEHWNWDGPGTCHNPGLLIDGLEDTASVDIPLAGAYDSSDSRIHEYHLDLAKAAGIDAYCVDWYGTPDSSDKNRDNIVDLNFRRMLLSAEAHKTKLCVCYEEKILFPKASDNEAADLGKRHMKYIGETYFSSPGYWHVDGRPVLIIWGNNRLATGVWKEILDEITGYNPWIIYSHHDHNPEYVNICDGFYPWVLLGNMDFQSSYLDGFYTIAKRYIEEGKSATLGGGVWPAFNDTGVWGWGNGARAIEDKDDKLYDLTWEYVLRHNPEWVSITTWNDWNEGSNIEPGVKKGIKYLRKTADYISKYKGRSSENSIEKVLEKHKERLRLVYNIQC